MLDAKQITDDLRGRSAGGSHFDALTRGLYATDASPFEVTPLAVAVPEDADDVAVLVSLLLRAQPAADPPRGRHRARRREPRARPSSST